MDVDGLAHLRITVAGPDPMVVDRDPAEGSGPEGSRHPRPAVRELPDTAESRAAGQRRYEAVVDGWVLHVTVERADRARLRERAARAAAAVVRHAGVTVRAQIPGRVVRIWVEAGDTVGSGQRLLAVEAMKMENEVRAPRAGLVAAVTVSAGQTVDLGDELVRLE
jgi:biotin carboxyl carrier protein